MALGRQIASDQLAASMHLRVALSAKGLEIDRIVCAAIVNFDDVMHLQFHRWSEALEVIFSPQAVPAVIAAFCGK